MKEIGGYFDLDSSGGNMPLPNGVLLNSGRNDDSSARQRHLIVRKEKGVSVGYPLIQVAEDSLVGTPIRTMSIATTAALQRFDATTAIQKRHENFTLLQERLNASFPLSLAEDDVLMAYPYVSADSTLRLRLIANEIYVAKYWLGMCPVVILLSIQLIPLLIDQRCGGEGMNLICEFIRNGRK